jgi:hypothetical protein
MRDRFSAHRLVGSRVASVWAVGFLDSLLFGIRAGCVVVAIIELMKS